MIRNIVFDIGNVLAEFSWREHLARFGFTGEKAERIGKAMMLNLTWNDWTAVCGAGKNCCSPLSRRHRIWNRRFVSYFQICPRLCGNFQSPTAGCRV